MTSSWYRRNADAMPSWPIESGAAQALLADLEAAPFDADKLDKALKKLLDALTVSGLSLLDRTALALRYLRCLRVMSLIKRDSTGLATLDEVTHGMSDLAELACQRLLPLAAGELAARWGKPLDEHGQIQDLHVLAMGKAGGRELNVSSDLDIVFVCRGRGGTQREDGTAATRASDEFMHQLARELTGLLTERTAAGFIFRVDTRLRPHGDSGPLVVNLTMLEHYFFGEGREWERFAWLKVRPIAHSGLSSPGRARDDLEQLNAIVRPFVFRRYLDFQAIEALRQLHGLIRQEVAKTDARKRGWDVKLGRGGIREIEFIAQLFQIVRGGRDPGLRAPQTLATLEALGERGILETAHARQLAGAYCFLRQLEHAIQYREDEQTHRLPDDELIQREIAQLLRLPLCRMLEIVHSTRDFVSKVFDSLLAQDKEPQPTDPDIRQFPGVVAERLAALQTSGRWQSARDDTRARLHRLMDRARHEEASEQALIRLVDFLESVLRRPAYLALLDEYPAALKPVLRLLDKARWASQYLLRHPVVLDELLDGQMLEAMDYKAWACQQFEVMQTLQINGLSDDERRMDHLREAHHAQVFRLLVQDLEGHLSLERLSDHLSELADQVLGLVIECAWASLKSRHREKPQFAAIAYGKLGGKELGYASDLDLVFVYADDDPQAPHAYGQLALRISSWMSMQTAAGQLFDVDVRLRPDGISGLAAISLQGYESYLREKAWVWEHQALTRARWSAGDKRLAPGFESIRREILKTTRDRKLLAGKVCDMRARMHAAHPNRSAEFDLKHDAGGMVDIEFMTQYLVLAYSHAYPSLLDNAGNIALLQRAADEGLIDKQLALQCADAYRRYRMLQHGLRLNEARYARVEPQLLINESQAVKALWATLFAS
ncbi:MAG: bifunctional [glutamate--ammonia ligase]-adenylyl-L-tyrosine phosphorylase/[glutamate--ammonia-ligase] adenylyltransferase [Betaproteobacteria bacterium]|jgi:[glutamine synthetase] adenylyltransferase / [glutamine synthetase]-adenylyl-L-tyrosine phosphorylase|nr:bifunctional [glutamate--ammonia ligase]-adenylyl-L-tyrosine phosphorylase/[glutamate--ammonia-ligase] adenylyltransferase [Betaproteobacteria bacterium]NBO95317.1 bifunctional [glutamate--ammonia ligase]-adenylyl-L-tyrosine phosphorylase/[glutamate--ammonia-ligase] adenylyltransferase [Betaproteobacteria bacterium]NBP34856.1 bifunctional [glutamate--ammonia ligase]-adenylyl-L-tyrosine phosphorylase/[glutamate--ammonia-ligase] adenylyltransferase [Betaproteobacteria bacterium]NBP38419.1 bifun